MSNETKRDVFVKLAEGVKIADSFDEEYPKSQEDIEKEYKENIHNYDAALPDNPPVIPKAVGEWIKVCKKNNTTLANALCMEMRPEAVRWWMEFKDGDIGGRFDYAGYPRKQEIMAKAWLLGVWRVEETGEIVKLEAEK